MKIPGFGRPTPAPGVDRPVCTYCGGDQFYEGPEGGMSINILCANPTCRHWFNWTAPLGMLDDLHRVEPTDEERVELRKQAVLERRAIHAKPYEEGRGIYKAGLSAWTCMQDQTDNMYNITTQADLFRLVGWLDEREGRAVDSIGE